jgi:hypothetical protein
MNDDDEKLKEVTMLGTILVIGIILLIAVFAYLLSLAFH